MTGDSQGRTDDSGAGLLSRLRASIDDATRQSDRSKGFLQSRVYRPLSIYLAAPFIRLGVSANQVTLLRLCMAAIALCLFVVGGHTLVMIASVLLLSNTLLDFVDGNIARFKGPIGFGDFFEAVVDPLVRILTPVALAIGLYRVPDGLVTAYAAALGPGWILGAGFATGLASSIKFFAASEFARTEGGDDDAARRDTDPLRAGGPIGQIYQTANNALQILIVVFALLDAISVWLAIVCASRCLTLPPSLISLYVRSRRPGARS